MLLALWQIYMKDLAEFRNFEVQSDGRYRDDRLRTYLSYENHWAYLIRCEDEIAGFSLVRKSKPDTFVIGEFFILSKFRRSGVGRSAVVKILAEFKGNWEIPFQIENSRAVVFWRQTIKHLGYQATEVESPEAPSDLLLVFTS